VYFKINKKYIEKEFILIKIRNIYLSNMKQKTDFSNLKFKRINHLNNEKSFDTNNNSIEKENDYLNTTNLEQANSFPGFFPFLRGYSTTGYILKPWTTNQNNCFSNEKKNYNFDEESFSSINEMSSWLEKNSSDDISISISINKKGIIYFAYFLIALEKINWKKNQLSINLIIKTNDSVYSNILLDCITYINRSNFYSLSIIYKNLDDNLFDSIVNSLTRSLQLIQNGINRDLKIDYISPLISLYLPVDKNSINEICKLRAIRIIWAKLIEEFSPQNYDSYKIKIHSFLKEENSEIFHQQIFNATNQALSSVLGGIESLNTTFKINENLSLEEANLIAKNLQLILQDETQICRTVDPLGGSFIIESITNEIAIKAYQKIKKVSLIKSTINSQFNINNILELTINIIKDNTTFDEVYSALESIIE